MNRKIIISVAAVTLVGSGLLARQAFAESSSTNPMQSLVQKIAAKFNLNQADVQAVFDQDRQEWQQQRQAEMKSRQETYLTGLVSQGKITEAQKTLILNKLQELETARQTAMSQTANQTPDERRSAMDAERQELDTWAKQNNIDPQYLMMGFGPKEGRGRPW